jgi:hypothetical protein
MSPEQTVRSYKLLSNVERAFRCLKSVDLMVRPIRHRLENRAHVQHLEPFDVKDLDPYRHAQPPPCEQGAIRRRRTMRPARSTKTLPDLLAQLEIRYINSS